MAAARNVSPAASITFGPCARNLLGELADGRGFAGAVDADHQDHERLLRAVDGERLGHRRQRLFDLAGQDGFNFFRRDLLVVAPLADRLA